MPWQPSALHEKILEVLRKHPDGISERDIRRALHNEDVQFGRRRRELHAHYNIQRKRQGNQTLYVLIGPKELPLDADPISPKLRAQALHAAQGRCRMCGNTINRDSITLVIDHKLPRDWGGKTVEENLWAICEGCNHGKKNLFSSMASPSVKSAMGHGSVHVRIGELLKAVGLGRPVMNLVIEFIATDQDDWKKRLRELRYLNWTIESSRKKMPDGRVRSYYTLKQYTDWPDEPTRWIRRYEEARRRGDPATLDRMKQEGESWPVHR